MQIDSSAFIIIFIISQIREHPKQFTSPLQNNTNNDSNSLICICGYCKSEQLTQSAGLCTAAVQV